MASDLDSQGSDIQDKALFLLSSEKRAIRIKVERKITFDRELSGMDLSFTDFGGMDLAKYSLRGANLSNSDLSSVVGLTQEKLAGTNLDGTKLPTYLREFSALGNISEAAKNINTILLSYLAAISLTILTIYQTSDAALLINASGAKLPLVQADLPVASFYLLAPTLLVVMFIYMNIQIDRAWLLIRTLPERFEDGLPTHAKIYPWFFLGLFLLFVVPKFYNKPRFYFVQGVICAIVLYFILPAFLFVLLLRYISLQDMVGIGVLCILTATTMVYAAIFLRSARGYFASNAKAVTPGSAKFNLSRIPRAYGEAAIIIIITSMIYVLAYSSIFGLPFIQGESGGNFLQRVFLLNRFPAHLDLSGAELAKKPLDWNRDNPSDALIAKIPRLRLVNINLRRAKANGVYSPNTNFSGSDLSRSDLDFAEIQYSDFSRADLRDASMVGVFADRATFRSKLVVRTKFREAVLRRANFDSAVVDTSEFQRSNLSNSLFNLSTIKNSDFSFAVLSGANFNSALVKNARFNSSVLEGGQFRNATLDDVVFDGANLVGVDFTGSQMVNVTFRDVDLSRTVISQSQLSASCGNSGTKLPATTSKDVRSCH